MRSGILRVAAWTFGLGVALPLPTARAAPPPLALGEAADGALDLRAGGALLAHVALDTPPLRRGPPLAREVTIDGRRVVEVRVAVRGTPREELWIAEVGGRAPRVVWHGLAGPRDADGETALDLAVTAEGVVEYQTASQVTRCDGAAVRLFPRAFDFESGRFRPVVSPLPEPARETLVGRRGDPAMPRGRPADAFHFTAASTTAAAGSDARDLTAPVAVDDGDPATAWTEGLGGDGRGEFLTARAGAGGAAVRGLRIVPGDASSAARFRARNRVRKLQLALGPRDDQRFDVELPEDAGGDAARFREPYWVPLPHPVPATCATVIITEVTPGTEAAPPKSWGVTAIGELSIFTDRDGPGGAEALVTEVARAADCAARVPALVALGAEAVLPTAEALMEAAAGGHTPPRECLVDALTRLEPAPKNPIVVEALVAAVGGASEKEESLVTSALRRAPEPPVAALAKLLDSDTASADDRARAARVIGALDDARAAEALLAAAGSGPPAQRDAVVLALSGAPKLEPAALFAAVGSAAAAPEREADLLRVVPAVVKRAPEAAPAALGVLQAALAVSRPFDVRARAVMALGSLGDAALPVLAEVRARASEPVLRHLAARELTALGGAAAPGAPRTSALDALRAGLGDADPRVRATAAEGLGLLRDAAAGPALIAGAKQEPWPFVRRSELEALGRLCGPGAADLLVRAVERDVAEVRRAALGALVRCKDPRAQALLLRVLGRRNEASTVRELSAALLGELGDRRAAPAMAAALSRQVNESEEDLSVEGVAEMTLRSLAHLGGPDATAAAVKLAKDKRHPFQSTAVEALGVLCDPGVGAATLRELSAGPAGALALAAQNAEKRCAGR
jgi:HEAT repeat protein